MKRVIHPCFLGGLGGSGRRSGAAAGGLGAYDRGELGYCGPNGEAEVFESILAAQVADIFSDEIRVNRKRIFWGACAFAAESGEELERWDELTIFAKAALRYPLGQDLRGTTPRDFTPASSASYRGFAGVDPSLFVQVTMREKFSGFFLARKKHLILMGGVGRLTRNVFRAENVAPVS